MGTCGVEGLVLLLDGSMDLNTESVDRCPGDPEEERDADEKEDDEKPDKLLARTGSFYFSSCGYGCARNENGVRLNGHRLVLLRPPLS